MSNALAIASVTAIFKDLLNNGIIDADLGASLGNVNVTALPPDRIDTSAANPQSQLNVFLFQVSPNPGWRNVALPSRNGNGDRISNPPLALDLHYLLTAYGASEFHSEILLGYGMQLLHETPVLTRDSIRKALDPSIPVAAGVPPELRALFSSGLADQVEQIKITPQSLSTEELFKLWSALSVSYRPTAVYHVSVVLIESRRPARSALPVLERQVFVVPFSQPVIDRLLSQATAASPIVANQPLFAGHILVIEGRQLRADDTAVRFDNTEVTPAASAVEPNRIRIAIPPSLPAGVHGVQVIHKLAMGVPPVPHRGFESNIAPFVLRPQIVSASIENVQNQQGGLRSGTAVIELDPGVGEAQRVVLLLNELNPPSDRPPRAYTFRDAEPVLSSPPGFATVVSIAVSGVVPGSYMARVQVDGAESQLETGASGQFNSPLVTI